MQNIIKDLLPLSKDKAVLLVDDDEKYLFELKELFEDIFDYVKIANNGEEALKIYEQNKGKFDIVATDLYMPTMGGIELIRNIQAKNINQIFLVISAYESVPALLECINMGIKKIVFKPGSSEELLKVLLEILLNLNKETMLCSHLENLEHIVESKTLALKDKFKLIQQMQKIDSTTNLPNYFSFLDDIKKLQTKQEITVVLFDIDNFNYVNQSYGFECGNKILKKIADLLLTCISNYEAKLFRYHSDEFILFFTSNIDNIFDIVHQIQVFFKNTPVSYVDDIPLFVTVSSGISISKNYETVVYEAAEALRNVKLANIPSQHSIYSSMSSDCKSNQNDFIWLQKVRYALENGNLVPYFHPIVDNNTQKIISYECLARIIENGKIIYPATFLGAAKKGALMCKITKTMIEQSFKIFKGRNCFFSINISHEDLLDVDFIKFVQNQIEKHNIDTRFITFEILENIIIKNSNDIILERLKALKKIGIKIALDDFGNENSNFNRFEYIGVDSIKIDGQFIKDIDKNVLNQSIVKSIVRLTSDLHIKVVAEYISNKEEYECAKGLGVHYSQGFYFYKPLNLPIWE